MSMDDAASPRPLRGAHLQAAEREDLDAYGVEELAERVERLRAEIARTEAAMGRKRSGRQAADALFSFGGG